ncbi:ATPase, AAA family [Lysobacter antibioticus]|uniref:ATP-binding protein n=1 Tax=Lysobacter antibioticus TaxID=84531 RepID=UPI0007172DF0|nr:ATP-binding protein [Lysobacter antibioticus]ALN64607.1 ATPase, AAA family [Lysobacter antibioticus]
MTLPIITADQRLTEVRGVKGVLVGRWGLGKTFQLWTLNPSTTLFVDIEAGDLAVKSWPGDSLRPRTWEECRDIAVLLGGPNPALRDGQPFSQDHYDRARQRYGDPAGLEKYRTIFLDSITVAGRLCLQWCKGQPQGFSDRANKPDTRGAYGLMGQEMVAWLTHIQHTRDRHIWFVGILDQRTDEFNRKFYELQIDGSKTGLELPGIVDEVITLAEVTTGDGPPYRAFVCHTANPWGFPAKDRSGRLDLVEPPDLGLLMRKLGAPEAAAPNPPPLH